MEILDKRTKEINTFFAALEEMANLINKAIKNRTPHLNGEKFLTGRDVCGMLHVSTRTLQQWRTQGKIPFVRLKGKILYKESEVLKCLETNGFSEI